MVSGTGMVDTLKYFTVTMKKNMLKWFGHVVRISDERMLKNIYEAKVSDKRANGRPWLTFKNTVLKFLVESDVKTMRSPKEYVCMLRG